MWGWRGELASPHFLSTLAMLYPNSNKCSLPSCLKMTLDRDATQGRTRRAVCGVLLCVEESQTATNTSLDQGDINISSSAVITISSLAIFRVNPTRPKTKPSAGRRTLIATVTPQEPSLVRVSNGIKMKGHLNDEQATLRLEMVKQDDCRAEFTCQAHGVDSQGRELVITSHLLQQPEGSKDLTGGESRDLGREGSWTPASALQFLSLVQQLDTRPAQVGQAIINLGDSLKRVEHELERSEDKTERLEDDIHRLESKIEDLNRGMGENIKSLENRLEDKLEKLTQGFLPKIEHVLNAKFTLFETRLQQNADTQSQAALQIQNSSNRYLLKLEYEVNELKNKNKISLQTVENSVKATLYNITKSLANDIKRDSAILKSSFETDMKDVSDMFNNSADITQSLLNQFHSQNRTRVRGELQTLMNDILRPTVCKKRMDPVVPQISFGYSVIYPSESGILTSPYLCDTFTDGGGWIVIQRRTTGKVDFYRDWVTYKKGFGSITDDFWLGNDNIYNITNSNTYELRIELQYNGKSAFARYDTFSIGDERSNYVLKLGSYSGTAGDGFRVHYGRQFSTHDRDNDLWPKSCAAEFTGAWWYNQCHTSNLNGKWGAGGNKGPRWEGLSGASPVSYSEMKIRIVE